MNETLFLCFLIQYFSLHIERFIDIFKESQIVTSIFPFWTRIISIRHKRRISIFLERNTDKNLIGYEVNLFFSIFWKTTYKLVITELSILNVAAKHLYDIIFEPVLAPERFQFRNTKCVRNIYSGYTDAIHKLLKCDVWRNLFLVDTTLICNLLAHDQKESAIQDCNFSIFSLRITFVYSI